MKKLNFLLCFFLISEIAQARSYRCADLAPTVESVEDFDSLTPSLIWHFVLKNPDGTVAKDETTTFLGPGIVCGVPTEFRKSCQPLERTRGQAYDFSYSCSNGTKGNVYFDGVGGGSAHCDRPDGTSDSMRFWNCSPKAYFNSSR